MYAKVIQLRPRDWRAQLNRAVSLLGAGEQEDSRKAFKEAFRMTNRLDIYDAIKHLKQRKNITAFAANAEQSATGRRTLTHGMFVSGGTRILLGSLKSFNLKPGCQPAQETGKVSQCFLLNAWFVFPPTQLHV